MCSSGSRKHRQRNRFSLCGSFRYAILVLGSFVTFAGCSNRQQAGQPSQSQSVRTSQSQPAASVSPPQLTGVQQAVKRVFKNAALIDENGSPSFVVGDFNGDRSEDIAVIIKTAPGKVSEMNQQFPPWILKDPFVNSEPGMTPLRVSERETLLAVIHGYGATGWHDSQATQTYLLKNVLGENIETRTKAEAIAANQGKKLPQLQGDLISETLRGKQGYLYYAGSTYSWYDPQEFQGEPIARPVHPGFATRN
jgi:hypothetical protein